MAASIELARCDIASVAADAIVNAANEGLQLGAGVAGAIRRAGGDTIQEECDRLGGCAVGDAVVTGAGKLEARWIIHAVGPVWRGGEFGEEMLLASAVRSALKRAEELGARSVALPAISTGVFGFPLRRAAEISIAAARSFAETNRTVERIIFCLFDAGSLRAFETAFEKG
ncbi:MAG: macro domain-containing protein [Thermoanaerobaculia bacterium]